MPPTKAASQVFRAVSVSAMERSTTLAASVAGGVLRISVQALPGVAAWVTTLAVWGPAPITPTIREVGTLFVALGINPNSFQAQSFLLKHKFIITYTICCFNNKTVYPF